MAAANATTSAPAVEDRLELGSAAAPVRRAAIIAGVVGLLAAVGLSFVSEGGARRFFLAYLVGYTYCLSIAIGAMFFVLIQYLTRAGWSVTVRRIAEAMGACVPVLAVLALPIFFAVLQGKGNLYVWAGSHDTIEKLSPAYQEAIEKKHAYLSPAFFCVRLAFYLLVWCWIGLHLWKQSVLQDRTGDWQITARLQALAGPLVLVLGVTVTFAAFDLMMSLDPTWYSTIFGVYYFAGGAVAFFAATILIVTLLHRAGYMRGSVGVEHYHDLGKFLFAFVFFWGYIAFSQYMLLWYASLPETAAWLARRGASTATGYQTLWSYWAVALLLGKLLIPFAGILSRHVKRNVNAISFWAVWLLVFHLVDLVWIVMPELKMNVPLCEQKGTRFSPIDVLAVVGVIGVFAWALMGRLASAKLRPTADPRLQEALRFHNI